jgi:hypothetical protein
MEYRTDPLPAAPRAGIVLTDRRTDKRLIDAAREAGASEDEAVFDENLKRLALKEEREPRK